MIVSPLLVGVDPSAALTLIGPVVAPDGIRAYTVESDPTWNHDAATPLNFTPVALRNPVPLIVTTVPPSSTEPLIGLKAVIEAPNAEPTHTRTSTVVTLAIAANREMELRMPQLLSI
jgi:hypothetical protein